MCCEEIFLKQLRDRGLRLTPQREMVLGVMHEIKGHATAEDIYARVHNLSSCVDISTVYRTLELLQELHLVTSLDPGDGQRRYELVGEHGAHPHLLCNSCGRLTRVEQEEIQPFVGCLRAAYGFEIALHDLIIPGVCQECLAHNHEPPRNGAGR